MSFKGFGYNYDEEEEYSYQTGKKSSSMHAQSKSHYQTLGVPSHASQAEIKKGYLNAAKIHHPDKGGDIEKFRQIQKAYETLNDPEKRRQYDTYGEKGQPQLNFDTSDLINLLFGGRRSGSSVNSSARSKPMMKAKPSKIVLHVTLEDIYNGHAFKIPHRRLRCCTICHGQGGDKQIPCKNCKGKGTYTRLTQLMPGMYQQSQVYCNDCSGKGYTVNWANLCGGCRGAKTIETEKTLQVVVEKGTPNNHEIPLYGQGDQKPGYLAGDVIVIVSVVDHLDFTRIGADLYMKKSITLLEALTGFKSSFTHLDGSVFNMETTPGEIINFVDKKTMYGMGMPFFKDPMIHGNLIIEFQVKMPGKFANFSQQQIRVLGEILPGKENQALAPGRPSMQLNQFKQSDLNTNPQGGNMPEQSKRQDAGEGLGCATQ